MARVRRVLTEYVLVLLAGQSHFARRLSSSLNHMCSSKSRRMLGYRCLSEELLRKDACSCATVLASNLGALDRTSLFSKHLKRCSTFARAHVCLLRPFSEEPNLKGTWSEWRSHLAGCSSHVFSRMQPLPATHASSGRHEQVPRQQHPRVCLPLILQLVPFRTLSLPHAAVGFRKRTLFSNLSLTSSIGSAELSRARAARTSPAAQFSTR